MEGGRGRQREGGREGGREKGETREGLMEQQPKERVSAATCSIQAISPAGSFS